MIKKIALIFMATLVVAGNSYSQKRIKTTQKIVALEDGRNGEVIIASLSDDDAIYMVTSVGKGRRSTTAITKYDKRMNVLKKTEWDLDYREGSFSSMQKLKDKLVVLFENADRKAKTTEVFARFVNENTLSLGKKNSLYEKEFESRRDMYGMNIQIENDFLLLYQTLEGKSKDQLKASFRVLNSDLEKQWEKEIVFPFTNRRSSFLDIELSKKENLRPDKDSFNHFPEDVIFGIPKFEEGDLVMYRLSKNQNALGKEEIMLTIW